MTKKVRVEAPRPSDSWRDRLIPVSPSEYQAPREVVGESYFKNVALDLLKAKWPVIPQQRSASRKPAVVDGCTLTYAQYKNSLPSEKDVRWWAISAPTENAAILLGPASGAFALDVDISDEALSLAVQDLADEMLGLTPLVRIGNYPKVARLYQMDAADPIPQKRVLSLITPEGKDTIHQIEVLANNSPLTAWGRHFRTQVRFQWSGKMPWQVRPKDLPVVSATRLQAFLEAVSARICLLTGLKRRYDSTSPRVATGAISPIRVQDGRVIPGERERVANVTFAGGKVVNGRETYIRSRAVHYVLYNHGLAGTEQGRHALAGALWAECQEVFDGLGDRFQSWGTEGDVYSSDTSVLAACRIRVESAKGFVDSTPSLEKRIAREENGKVHRTIRSAVAVDRGQDTALSWLDAGEISLSGISDVNQEANRLARALVFDDKVRHAGQDKVAGVMRSTARRLLGQVRAFVADQDAEFKIIILKAPTGAGKTSTMVEELGLAGSLGGSVLFLLPSYNNIDEVVQRARNPKALKEASASATFKDALKDAMGAARNMKLSVGVLTGKERGGCLMTEHLAMLRKHKLPASGLCQAKVQGPYDDEPTMDYCIHHPDHPDGNGVCPVILTRRELAEKNVIFAPTAFLTTQLPAGLKGKIKGLIIDERCIFELLRYDLLPLDVLLQARPEPSLTKKEREAGLTAQDLLFDRDEAGRIAHEAMTKGECPADALERFRQVLPNGGVRKGEDLVDAAITVAGRSQRIAQEIVPNMPIPALTHLFEGGKAEHLAQEHRFFSIIKERIKALRQDRVLRELAQSGGTTVDPALLQARGDRDLRIQRLHPGVIPGTATDMVRLSWIDEPNLAGVPTLLLDASADPDLIAKAWGGCEVEVVDVPAYLHLRTVVCMDSTHSTSSFLPGLTDNPVEKRARSNKLKKLRRAINNIAHVEGAGRVGGFMPQKIRKAVMESHAEAPNVDFGHYGAIKGLDFAKLHKAVLTVGRHAFPTWIIDALAACCAYNDVTPEYPYDAAGTGKDPKTNKDLMPPMVDRVYELRDGRDLTVQVTEYPGYWARKIERQFREEEQRQAMGRLRPVYRDEVGTWIAISKILPEDTVIDAVTTLDTLADLNKAGAVFEAVRRVGVVDHELLSRLAPDAAPAGGYGEVLDRHGLGGRDVSGPLAKGMDAYRVRVDGQERFVQVPGYDLDAQQTIIGAYDAVGRQVQGIALVAEGADKVRSQVKAPDKVDAELGMREERAQREEEARQAAREHVRAVASSDDWLQPFGPTAPVRVEPEAVDVEIAMILTTQGGVAPEEAAEPTDSRPAEACVASAASDRQSPKPVPPRPAPVFVRPALSSARPLASVPEEA